MKDKLTPAVDALLEKLNEQLSAASDTKKTINQLCVIMGDEPMFPDVESGNSYGPARADQYYGKSPTVAAEEYLNRRHQACAAEEIQRGMEQGGFDFGAMDWKLKDRVRMLAITLAKNPQKFHKLPNNTFGLLAWYPNVTAKREKAEKATPDSASAVQPQQAEVGGK
jgi:hypothetical protein